jgi:pullulanase/glycogen debranching enzyme
MVKHLHQAGFKVVLDVVYNHTFNKTMFEKITDKYYLKGDLSGCGNTVNADNNMVWMMIRDSMDYWVSEFHIDGFRLDLVGAFSMKDFSDWGE